MINKDTVRTGVLGAATGLALWALWVAVTGGVMIRLPWVTISSRAAWRPLVGALMLAALYVARYRGALAADAATFATVRWAKGIAIITMLAAFLVAVEYSSFFAAGPDSSGYISEAHKWMQGELRSPIPAWAARPGWAGALVAGAPVGYTLDAREESYVPIYSPGLPLIMSMFERVGGANAVFYVVPFFGALLVWLTYLLGRELGDEWSGAIAATLLFFSPAFLWWLIQLMSDVPVAACWTASLVLAARAGGTGGALFSGLAAGIAILIRPNLAPLAVFPTLLLLLSGTSALARAAVFAVAAAPAAFLIAIINTRLYGSPLGSGYGSLGALYALGRVSLNVRRYGGWLLDTQTPLIILWIAAPWASEAYDVRRRVVLLLLYPFAVMSLYLAYLNFDLWANLRFLLPAYPVMLAGLAAVLVRFVRELRPRSLSVAGVAVIIVSLVVHQSRFASNVGTFSEAERETRFVRAVDFARTLPPESIFISDAYSGTLHFYTGRDVLRWLWIPGDHFDEALADLKAQGRRLYFVGDPFEVDAFKEYLGRSNAAARFDAHVLPLVGETFVASELTPP
jgi:hypothetical protein